MTRDFILRLADKLFMAAENLARCAEKRKKPMTMSANDIDRFLNTDSLRFDTEVNEFPNNYRKVAEAVADARRDVDLAKVAVEVAKEELKAQDADLSIKIRIHPEVWGLAKATEASIEAAIATDIHHEAAFKRLITAKTTLANYEHACGVLEAALAAMDNKGKLALGKGVELMLANIRSTPRDMSRMPSTGRRAEEY